jgi:hypothetical protein
MGLRQALRKENKQQRITCQSVSIPSNSPVWNAAAQIVARLQNIKKVRDFMKEDLAKTIELHRIPRLDDPTRTYGAPNFLIALVLCCYTEFWRRLVEGIPEGKSRQCFEAFFKRLGKEYGNLISIGVDVYRDVRCGLAHSYFVSKTANINFGSGQCGIMYNNAKYTFNILTYKDDLIAAVDRYVIGLGSGTEDLAKFLCAISGKAVLL